MAYASAITASSAIRMPSVAMPNLRRLRLSKRTRALLMMAIMISPTFLADDIGYGVQRLFKTADQIAEMRAPDSILTRARIFQVACPVAGMPTAEQERWTAEAALKDRAQYP